MTARPRRAGRGILFAIFVILGVGVYWAWAPLAWLVEHERVPAEWVTNGLPVRGWEWRPRWGDDDEAVRSRLWYVETGYLAESYQAPPELRITEWYPDGKVRRQIRPGQGGNSRRVGREVRDMPPWWWGVVDRPSDRIPAWMQDDTTWAEATRGVGPR